MDWQTILQVITLGVALSMDAFCVSICDGLCYKNIKRGKQLFIAADFGLMQGLMPLIGYFIAYFFSEYVDITSIVPWIAFVLLLLISGKMIIDGIKGIRNPKNKCPIDGKPFTIGVILISGVATSIDALATGVSMIPISTPTTIFLHCSIITIITFIFCIIGLIFGQGINKLLKGKYEVANIIGGCVLVLLGCWILIEGLLGL